MERTVLAATLSAGQAGYDACPGKWYQDWPDASFRAVADWWRGCTGGTVVVILGPVEDEKGDYAALCQGAVVARSLNLGKLVALLVQGPVPRE